VADLTVTRGGGIHRLTFDRPERRNALTPASIEAAIQALEAADADREARALVVTGAGGAFCAGYDVELLDGTGARDLVEELCGRLAALRLPTVARVDGVASGAGCDLAVSCDLRIASPAARFGMPPARLGIVYGWQGTRRLARLIGPAAAKELLFTAAFVEAERALALGLVNRVTADLDAEVETLLGAIAGNAPLAVAAAKRTVDLVAAGPLDAESIAEIERISALAWESEDAREGRAAFRERRPPRFRGA
jgi:enoyl-CoA hydratase/carnithine racemase